MRTRRGGRRPAPARTMRRSTQPSPARSQCGWKSRANVPTVQMERRRRMRMPQLRAQTATRADVALSRLFPIRARFWDRIRTVCAVTGMREAAQRWMPEGQRKPDKFRATGDFPTARAWRASWRSTQILPLE